MKQGLIDALILFLERRELHEIAGSGNEQARQMINAARDEIATVMTPEQYAERRSELFQWWTTCGGKS